MSQVNREDWWTMPLEDFAKEVWATGWDRSKDERPVMMMSGILQTRAVLEAAAGQRKLVHATWGLVVVTALLALGAFIAG